MKKTPIIGINLTEQEITEMRKAVASLNGHKSWEARVKKHGKKKARAMMKEYANRLKKHIKNN